MSCPCDCHLGPHCPCTVPGGCGHLHERAEPELPGDRCLTHRPPKPSQHWKRADPGYRTCSACYDRLHAWLSPLTVDDDGRPDSIPGLYVLLDPRPGHGETGRRGPGFGSRSPANDHVIAMKDSRSTRVDPGDPHSVPGMLWAWCSELADQRRTQLPTRSVLALTAFLDAHLDWLTRQDWIPDLFGELRELHRQLKATAAGESRRAVGACPNTIDEGDHTRSCDATLFAPLYGDTITCWACTREWTRREWMTLGDLLEAG